MYLVPCNKFQFINTEEERHLYFSFPFVLPLPHPLSLVHRLLSATYRCFIYRLYHLSSVIQICKTLRVLSYKENICFFFFSNILGHSKFSLSSLKLLSADLVRKYKDGGHLIL